MPEASTDIDTELVATAAEESSLDGDEFDDLFSSQPGDSALAKENLVGALPEVSETASRVEKGSALRQALMAISVEESGAALSDADLEALRAYFCKIYGGDDGYRHEYSTISALMYELLEESVGQSVDLADSLPYELNTLATNMTTVRTHLERLSGEDDTPSVPRSVLGSVQKLDDHIELEFQRMKYQVKQNQTLHRNVDELTEGFQSRVAAAEEELTRQLEESIQETKAKFERDVKDTEVKSQRNYVSVLGIFISLVISFSAGIRLSTEAVQALSGMGVYRFAAVLTIVVFGMFDLILTLLFFILIVSDLDGGARKLMKWTAAVGNVAFVATFAFIAVARFFRLFG